MKITIIGLPNSGKTTVFNALTRGSAETTSYASGRLEPHLATVKVPDPRLQALAQVYKPRKVTPAEVQYVDVGGFGEGEKRGGSLPPELLNYLSGADALLHVVRAFKDESVPHPAGTIEPVRDIASLDLDLILSDLGIVERRLERLEKDAHKLPAPERARAAAEKQVLERIKETLEQEVPIRDLELAADEERHLRSYQFLSAKPMLLVVNIEEEQISTPPQIPYRHRKSRVVALSAKVEADLALLEDQEAREFMEDLGIKEPARDRVISESYALLGLISFVTVGEDEVRAWTIREGTPAVEAAGAVHSDIQRGFIRAEVVSFEDHQKSGGMAEAKKMGVLRLEGKTYVVQDGDICHFLFNV